jgi:hypothetical protein
MPEPAELEAMPSALAGRIEWPVTPQLKAVIPSRAGVLPLRPRFQGRWAMAAVAVLVLLATLLAYTPTRTAIADWLNLHINIRRTTALPTPSPLPSLGSNLGLGTQTTLEGAQANVKWQVLVPGQLGRPDAVYLQLPPDGPSGGEVSLVYATSPVLPVSSETGVAVLVTEARGRVNEQFFGKMLNDATTIEPVTVNGHQGWWISGQPHNFVFIASDGTARFETLRLATNTLVIDDSGTIVRIEGHMTKAQALQIAGTLA